MFNSKRSISFFGDDNSSDSQASSERSSEMSRPLSENQPKRQKRKEPWRLRALNNSAVGTVSSMSRSDPSIDSDEHQPTFTVHTEHATVEETLSEIQEADQEHSSNNVGIVDESQHEQFIISRSSQLTKEEIKIALHGDDILKEKEAKRLFQVLSILVRGTVSRENCRLLMGTDIVGSSYSFLQMEDYVKKRSKVTPCCAPMCGYGHMAATGNLTQSSQCQTEGCNSGIGMEHKFWYSHVSEQLQALCREGDSFCELMRGCDEAKRAVSDVDPEILFDYYDGALFRRAHSKKMLDWNSETELYVFLSMTLDGFKVFSGPDGKHSCWPVSFTVLNFGPQHRFKAANCLISAIIPGKHDGDYFDTFLEPIVSDLKRLEDGNQVFCADGKTRVLKGFLVFITGDWPAYTKIGGFMGHNSNLPCRFCHKKKIHNFMIPTSTSKTLKKFLRPNNRELEWIECETTNGRSGVETRGVWKQLQRLRLKGLIPFGGDGRCAISARTGIKCSPVVSNLTIDALYSFPYDPMHLCLAGWTRTLLLLLCDAHKKHRQQRPWYIFSDAMQMNSNESVENGTRGLPASWGRAPRSMMEFSKYKAEELKTFAVYYGVILFSRQHVHNRIARLWACVRRVMQLVFHPTPKREDVYNLRRYIQELHAFFTNIFYEPTGEGFCFTPSTHALLHLPEIMKECGPLANISQFLPKRLVGELGKYVKSRTKPEANLFNASHRLFSFRLLGGGLHKDIAEKVSGVWQSDEWMEEEDEDDNDHLFDAQSNSTPLGNRSASPITWQLLGSGTPLEGRNVPSLTDELVTSGLPTDAINVEVVSILNYQMARRTEAATSITFETLSNFRKREKASSGNVSVRQKCWIVGAFVHSKADETEDADGLSDIYYGCVTQFLSVEVGYDVSDHHSSESGVERILLAQVEWQDGLLVDTLSGIASSSISGKSRRGTLKDKTSTVESVNCIQRLIGFFDHDGKRYFMDARYGEAGERVRGLFHP